MRRNIWNIAKAPSRALFCVYKKPCTKCKALINLYKQAFKRTVFEIIYIIYGIQHIEGFF